MSASSSACVRTDFSMADCDSISTGHLDKLDIVELCAGWWPRRNCQERFDYDYYLLPRR